jgi:hypothetical protein
VRNINAGLNIGRRVSQHRMAHLDDISDDRTANGCEVQCLGNPLVRWNSVLEQLPSNIESNAGLVQVRSTIDTLVAKPDAANMGLPAPV